MVDTDGPRMVVGSTAVLSFVVMVVAFEEGVVALALVGGLVLPPAAGALVGSFVVQNTNQGRGRTRRSRWIRSFARVMCLNVRDCGCIYGRGITYHAPDTEWVESERVWFRSHDGARVEFRRGREGMKRCHRCGKHYHATDIPSHSQYLPGDRHYECWPEEEPNVREKLNGRIVGEEAV